MSLNMANLCLCKTLQNSSLIVHFLSVIIFFVLCCHAIDTLPQGQVLRDGETLISAKSTFEFGFFSPPKSSSRYVGIWYYNISVDSVVWVANRNAPISGQNGSLVVGKNGNLVVFDGVGRSVWSSNTSIASSIYNAKLHDDGNFEIWGLNNVTGPNITCWQSFDHPGDTYLPGMRVRVNEYLGEMPVFSSWRGDNDPATGNYTLGVDPRAAPQFVIWEGPQRQRRWRSGHWNGMKFIGVPTMAAFYNYGFKLSNIDSSGNMYFSYTQWNMSNVFKFKMTWDGYEKSLIDSYGGKAWSVTQSQPSSDCDRYNKCGVNGYCTETANPICDCFEGFRPKFLNQWNKGNWSGGCVRKTPLQCEKNHSLIGKDGFLEVDSVKLPDFANLLSTDEEGCEQQCLNNCSCMAYSYVSTIGCMTWSGDLFDLQCFQDGANGNKLHIRVPSSDIGSKGKLSGPKVAAIVLGGVILLSIPLLCLWQIGIRNKVSESKRESDDGLVIGLRKNQGYSTDVSGSQEMSGEGNLANTPDLSLFNYNLVASATNFFSAENKLGQGGFGPVYKGILPGGQEVAVKKLSRKSGQGMEEFKNEIMLIAKLQHRNLVRILGCCMHGEEKMLLYEYMPNKSLDFFIFDPTKRGQLEWRKRFTIIEGIARGLLYLHRDARFRIIHRDLKASNILLDQEMNPKISDFGMARIFGGDQDEANTNRVVGTYGYMSPEYAMEGFFSERSDVYSFGVLLLEVISGQRNARFRFHEHMNLIEYAWQLWSEGRTKELIDSSIGSSSPTNEVSRSVHIAMLCVQDSAVYRPTMSQVVLWLESDSLALPNPIEPTLTYSSTRRFIDIDCKKGAHDTESSNDVTITNLVGR